MLYFESFSPSCLSCWWIQFNGIRYIKLYIQFAMEQMRSNLLHRITVLRGDEEEEEEKEEEEAV